MARSEEQDVTRWVIFSVLISFWLVAEIFIGVWNEVDDCFVTYSMDFILSSACFFVYAWWWWREGSPSPIYVAITFLFLGILTTSGIQFYARYLRATDFQASEEFLNSTIWSMRVFPKYVAMSFMFSWIASRLLTGKSHG